MKLFVTGVAGQLGHDVMNELNKRGYEGVGSDLAPEYSGIQDSTAVTTMPYISVADKKKLVYDVLGALRLELAKQMNLLDKNEYRFVKRPYSAAYRHSLPDCRCCPFSGNKTRRYYQPLHL